MRILSKLFGRKSEPVAAPVAAPAVKAPAGWQNSYQAEPQLEMVTTNCDIEELLGDIEEWTGLELTKPNSFARDILLRAFECGRLGTHEQTAIGLLSTEVKQYFDLSAWDPVEADNYIRDMLTEAYDLGCEQEV